MKNKKIKIPIYPLNLVLIHTQDKLTVEKMFDVKNTEDDLGMSIYKGNTINIVFFEQKPTLNTIVHEIIHAVNQILLCIGAEHDVHNDETSAYLGGWVADEIEKFLKLKHSENI